MGTRFRGGLRDLGPAEARHAALHLRHVGLRVLDAVGERGALRELGLRRVVRLDRSATGGRVRGDAALADAAAHRPDELARLGALEVADRELEVAALLRRDRPRDALGRLRVELGDRPGPVARLPRLAGRADVEGLKATAPVAVAVAARAAVIDDLVLDAVRPDRDDRQLGLRARGL